MFLNKAFCPVPSGVARASHKYLHGEPGNHFYACSIIQLRWSLLYIQELGNCIFYHLCWPFLCLLQPVAMIVFPLILSAYCFLWRELFKQLQLYNWNFEGKFVFVGRQLCWKDHLVFICHAVCMDVLMYVTMYWCKISSTSKDKPLLFNQNTMTDFR